MRAKIFLTLSVSALLLLSCSMPNPPQIINEEYNPSADSLYTACKDLKGVGQYIIGETTLKQVLKDKDYLANNPSKYLRRDNNLYNGHWGSSFINTTDIEKTSWMEKQAKGEIKQLHPEKLDFTMGEIVFDDFDMVFLNDTLVAIYFEPSDKNEEEILKHYQDKYGMGRGTYYKSEQDNEPQKDRDNLFSETTEKADIVWENEDIALHYTKWYHFKMEPYCETHYFSQLEYLIYSKNRYPVFEEKLKALAKAYDDMKATEKETTLNNL